MRFDSSVLSTELCSSLWFKTCFFVQLAVYSFDVKQLSFSNMDEVTYTCFVMLD